MPRLDRDPDSPQGPLVQGFAAGGFSVDGSVYPAVLLTPEWAQAWRAPAVADLAESDLAPVLALNPAPEFILLGTGPTIRFPARALIRSLEARGVGVEVMDSRAAARTWGLLRAEERWIAAALMPLA
ncbi:hypothetical protein E2493_07870 [Sphingomonas parva]|uniref:Xcc1710-like domain-containing protein n=1 Tax=Sphingomonas parva TaxID=2555898 RepID=A0A4Y8ZRZ0_9SPHN|nr:Mth938-like domain-containing protein [Sphingomonas parva]TFI58773.1 hypothetical protein E2493_07870 [Sphingomonas parva]